MGAQSAFSLICLCVLAWESNPGHPLIFSHRDISCTITGLYSKTFQSTRAGVMQSVEEMVEGRKATALSQFLYILDTPQALTQKKNDDAEEIKKGLFNARTRTRSGESNHAPRPSPHPLTLSNKARSLVTIVQTYDVFARLFDENKWFYKVSWKVVKCGIERTRESNPLSPQFIFHVREGGVGNPLATFVLE
ncbi:hypothetical protein BKA70DRAFT_1225347 [Coprinopsis sp. MPI-PUGE-AT-0042]|nr:hypothetical protein BKA70DRAFT_1225347 [Coprinopsis sp. MPI-PUGE-AT-0042]